MGKTSKSNENRDPKSGGRARAKCPAGCTCGKHKGRRKKGVQTNEMVERQKRFLAALVECANIVAPALKMADVPRDTFKRWKADDEWFRDQLENIKADRDDAARVQIWRQFMAGEPNATKLIAQTLPEHQTKTFHDITTKGEKITAPNVVFVPAVQNGDNGE